MLPRNRVSGCILFCLAFILVTGESFAQDTDRGNLADQGKATNVFIRFYQDHISGVDGNRCSMTPSCSAYAAQSIKKHGMMVGWAMACDRLLRCGRDETRISPTRLKNGQMYTYDPVEANDFWWFKPPLGGETPLK